MNFWIMLACKCDLVGRPVLWLRGATDVNAVPLCRHSLLKLMAVLKSLESWAVMTHAFNPSTWKQSQADL